MTTPRAAPNLTLNALVRASVALSVIRKVNCMQMNLPSIRDVAEARDGQVGRTVSDVPMLKCALEPNEASVAPRAASEGDALASFGSRAQPTREAEGGVLGNTPPASSQAGPPPSLNRLSIDTLHACIWVDYGKREAEILQRFEAAKACAVDAANAKYDEQTPEQLEEEDVFPGMEGSDYFRGGLPDGREVIFGGVPWLMGAWGIPGSSKGKPGCPYRLQYGGIVLGFRPGDGGNCGNVWCEIGSIPLAQHGPFGAWDFVKGVFEAEGLPVVKNLPSRHDPYVDTDRANVAEVRHRYEDGYKVCRAVNSAHYVELEPYAMGRTYFKGMKCTGFTVGQAIRLRVYDKAEELKNSPEKWAVFSEKYDGIPDTLTRVEFQLRRSTLKELYIPGADVPRIDTVEDLLRNQTAIWEYLTSKWFRLTEDRVDAANKNQTREETWEVWRHVQEAGKRAYGDESSRPCVRKVRRIEVDVAATMDSIGGQMAKLIVYANNDIEAVMKNPFFALIAIMRVVLKYLKNRGVSRFRESLQKHAERKRELLGSIETSILSST